MKIPVNTTKLKKAAKTPKFNPSQIILLVITLGFFALTQTDWFTSLDSVFRYAVYGGFFVLVLLMGNPLGKTEDLVRGFMKILSNGQTPEQKIIQLQNLLVAISQQLGLYYEKELEKISNKPNEQ